MNLKVIHRLTFVKNPLRDFFGIVAYTKQDKKGKQTIVMVYPQILRDWSLMYKGGEEEDKDLKLLADYVGYVFTHELIVAICAEDKLLEKLRDSDAFHDINRKLAYICGKLDFFTAQSDLAIRESGKKLIMRFLGLKEKIKSLGWFSQKKALPK